MASIIKIIAGIFILLIGLPIFLGGSAILIVVPIFTDNEGYFMTNSFNIEQEGVAAIRIDIPLDEVYIGVRIDPSEFVTLKMNVHGPNNEQIFVGLASDEDVDQVLNWSVSYVLITDFEYYSGFEFGQTVPKNDVSWTVIHNISSTVIPDIDKADWFPNTGMTGNTFQWAPTFEELTSGALSVVLMNDDLGMDNSINITFSIGAKVPIVNAIGWILLIFGGLFSLLGIILVWSGIRSKKPKMERVRYYYGAPTQKVETIEKPVPKFQLQCSNCGSLNEPDSTFCSQCGEILLSEDKKTLEDVRKEKEVEMYQPAGNKLVVADGGARFWAWLIDILIVGAITSALSSMVFFTLGDWSWWSFGIWNPLQWFFSLGPSSLVFFVYSLAMEYYYGQTLGKMILNLEIVSERTGQRPTVGEIALSSLGKAFFLPLDVFFGWISRDQYQIPNLEQRITQKWARVVVIRQEKRKEEKAQFVSSRI